MSTAELVKVDPRQQSLKEYFERAKSAVAQVVPKFLTAERVLKVALTATARTPALLKCTPQSLLQSVMSAAQLGLEPGGPLGHAYLVPYGTECTLIVGYRGLIALARRSGEIDSIEAHVVYQRDKFRVAYGLLAALEHEPHLDGDPGPVVAAYAIARLKGGVTQHEFMTKAQIDAVRGRSKAAKNGPWVTDYDEMARKTVVRRLCKYLPLTVEIREQLEQAEESAQRFEGLVDVPITASATDGDAPADEKPAASGGEQKQPAPTPADEVAAALRQRIEAAETMQALNGVAGDVNRATLTAEARGALEAQWEQKMNALRAAKTGAAA